jgi:hypothetical protein
MAPPRKSRESLEAKPSRKLTEFFSSKPISPSAPGPSSGRTSYPSSELEHEPDNTRKNAPASSPLATRLSEKSKSGKQKSKARESNGHDFASLSAQDQNHLSSTKSRTLASKKSFKGTMSATTSDLKRNKTSSSPSKSSPLYHISPGTN